MSFGGLEAKAPVSLRKITQGRQDHDARRVVSGVIFSLGAVLIFFQRPCHRARLCRVWLALWRRLQPPLTGPASLLRQGPCRRGRVFLRWEQRVQICRRPLLPWICLAALLPHAARLPGRLCVSFSLFRAF